MPGTVELTVVYARKIKIPCERVDPETGEVTETWFEEYTKKIKRTVFATERPKLYSEIEVQFA